MNTPTLILLIIIGAAVAGAVIYIARHRGGCGSCSGCSCYDSCARRKSKR